MGASPKLCNGYYLLVDEPKELAGIWNVVEFDRVLLNAIDAEFSTADKRRVIKDYVCENGVFSRDAEIVVHRIKGKNVLMQRVAFYN